jgi:hypothetical protein
VPPPPPCFVLAGKRIYQNLVVVLKIKEEVVELPQSVGVQQGNNMALVLFLFLMSAFAETLEMDWENAGIEVCTVCLIIGDKLTSGKGKLRGHLSKEYLSRELTTVDILKCLYVDDGAFIFASLADMTKGLICVHKHIDHLGLEMHIGHGDTPSKTECVFFPPPGFFDSHMPSLLNQQESSKDFNSTLYCGEDTLTKDERQDK